MCSLVVENDAHFQKIEYLLHSNILTIVRKFDQQQDNGIVVTKMAPKALMGMAGASATTGFVQEVVKNSQRRLSSSTAVFMRQEALQLKDSPIKDRINHILSFEHKVDRRTFLCFFYAVKTLLFRLREGMTPICLKSVSLGSEPFFVFLEPKEKDGEFQIVLSDNFPDNTVMFIFEMVVGVTQQELMDRITQYGFTEIVLELASREFPYEKGTDLSAIPDEGAREEVALYRKRNTVDFCELDHIYLDQVANKGVVYDYR